MQRGSTSHDELRLSLAKEITLAIGNERCTFPRYKAIKLTLGQRWSYSKFSFHVIECCGLMSSSNLFELQERRDLERQQLTQGPS